MFSRKMKKKLRRDFCQILLILAHFLNLKFLIENSEVNFDCIEKNFGGKTFSFWLNRLVFNNILGVGRLWTLFFLQTMDAIFRNFCKKMEHKILIKCCKTTNSIFYFWGSQKKNVNSIWDFNVLSEHVNLSILWKNENASGWYPIWTFSRKSRFSPLS